MPINPLTKKNVSKTSASYNRAATLGVLPPLKLKLCKNSTKKLMDEERAINEHFNKLEAEHRAALAVIKQQKNVLRVVDPYTNRCISVTGDAYYKLLTNHAVEPVVTAKALKELKIRAIQMKKLRANYHLMRNVRQLKNTLTDIKTAKSPEKIISTLDDNIKNINSNIEQIRTEIDNSTTTAGEKAELQKVIDTSAKQIEQITDVKDTLSRETSAGILSSPKPEDVTESIKNVQTSLKTIITSHEKKIDTSLLDAIKANKANLRHVNTNDMQKVKQPDFFRDELANKFKNANDKDFE